MQELEDRVLVCLELQSLVPIRTCRHTIRRLHRPIDYQIPPFTFHLRSTPRSCEPSADFLIASSHIEVTKLREIGHLDDLSDEALHRWYQAKGTRGFTIDSNALRWLQQPKIDVPTKAKLMLCLGADSIGPFAIHATTLPFRMAASPSSSAYVRLLCSRLDGSLRILDNGEGSSLETEGCYRSASGHGADSLNLFNKKGLRVGEPADPPHDTIRS
ncbi:hypothetical protein NM688_g4200 [Phlebia brevispora]|uniref:Uncharacterized protein n=1 Tax=Phlebia brevispora TaxID=194682 RepID=A0ACC1T3D9_9APHY|nr:hypothetical protein NM688_g4200 [Phlebia brevispora]